MATRWRQRRPSPPRKTPKGSSVSLLGSILGPKTAPKRSQKRSKNEAKNKRPQKTIQDDLGPILERSWAHLGSILAFFDLMSAPSDPREPRFSCSQTYVRVIHHLARSNVIFFEDISVRRGLWDQLGPTKAPKGPKTTPKTEPKPTPKRQKNDTKINKISRRPLWGEERDRPADNRDRRE